MTVSLNQQIDEVKRELAKRDEVYPRQVQTGKLRQSIADFQVERMRAVLKTLEWLQAHEQQIKIMMTEGT
jgi:hypothetical protein